MVSNHEGGKSGEAPGDKINADGEVRTTNDGSTGLPTDLVKGVGEKRKRKLSEAGVETALALSTSNPDKLADVSGIPAGVAYKLVNRAQQEVPTPSMSTSEFAEWNAKTRVAVVGWDGWGDVSGERLSQRKGQVAMAMMESPWDADVVLRCGDGMGDHVIQSYVEQEARNGRLLGTQTFLTRWDDFPEEAWDALAELHWDVDREEEEYTFEEQLKQALQKQGQDLREEDLPESLIDANVRVNDWGGVYYRFAGGRRNEELLATADGLVVVSKDASSTEWLIQKAEYLGVPVYDAEEGRTFTPTKRDQVANASHVEEDIAEEKQMRADWQAMNDYDDPDADGNVGGGEGQKKETGYLSGQ